MDLSKLTPAPWEERGFRVWAADAIGPLYVATTKPAPKDDMGEPLVDRVNGEFIALARNAFDVMVRRGWGVVKCSESDQWVVSCLASDAFERPGGLDHIYADDPFTALVEADKWYKANVEGAS